MNAQTCVDKYLKCKMIEIVTNMITIIDVNVADI